METNIDPEMLKFASELVKEAIKKNKVYYSKLDIETVAALAIEEDQIANESWMIAEVKQRYENRLANAIEKINDIFESMKDKISFNLTNTYVENLAIMSIKSMQDGNKEWLKTCIENKLSALKKQAENYAKIKEFYPFILFNISQYRVFCDLFGKKSFSLMEKWLDDPKKISPQWAVQFITTAQAYGLEKCVEEFDKGNNIYKLLIGTELWKNSFASRGAFSKEHKKYVKAIKKKREAQEENLASKT